MMQHPNLNAPSSQMQQQSIGASASLAGAGASMFPPNVGFATMERSQRSVFVGNIPYEATEEELKELFSQVGPVVGFRLVLDRETGKSKGYGFCEYVDQETASSALRNLNGFEFHGRNLRIDTAAGDRGREEQLQMTLGPPQDENPYGPSAEPTKAPEAIGRAVASLPPEQMFELMKQMKLCIQTNPNEARNMLLQNPQLAYALLQALVVMRIVDPQVAMTMFHRDTDSGSVPSIIPQGIPPIGGAAMNIGGVGIVPPFAGGFGRPPAAAASSAGDIDYRSGFPPPMAPNFMGISATGFVPPAQSQPIQTQQSQQAVRAPFSSGPSILDRTTAIPPAAVPPVQRTTAPASAAPGEDKEKAALIMQVLQLTDEQIAMLPSDQKQSVLLLREQLRGTQR